MSTLSNELRTVIEERLKIENASEILAIASTLCAQENGAAAIAPHIAAAAARGQRFTVDGDFATDATMGLMWTRKNVGDKPLKWADAKAAAEAVRIGDHTDWRLPTVRELLTLVDYERSNPAIDPVFQCDSAWYWTCTPAAASPSDCAWIVSFSYGGSFYHYHGYEARVRAVRAGQIVGTLV